MTDIVTKVNEYMVDAHDKFTKEFEFDTELLNETLNISRRVITTIAIMKYPDNTDGIQSAFVMTILANLVGNFIVELSDKNMKGALENNADVFICQLQDWFEKVKQLKSRVIQ